MSRRRATGVFDVGVLSGAEQIVGEGAQARDNVGGFADARRVSAKVMSRT